MKNKVVISAKVMRELEAERCVLQDLLVEIEFIRQEIVSSLLQYPRPKL